MADEVIREQVIIEGDASKGVAALRSVADEGEKTERRISGVGQRIQGFSSGVINFLRGIASGGAKLGAVAAGGAALATQGFTKAGAASGLLTGTLLKLNPVAGLIASTLGALGGTMVRLATQSDQAQRVSKTWERIKATLSAPFANVLANGFTRLNTLLESPAAQKAIHTFQVLETLLLQKLTPVVYGVAGAFAALLGAIADLDFSNILTRVVKGFQEGAAAGVQDAGKNAGATWSRAFTDEAAANLRDEAPDRLARNIGDLGTALLDRLLSGLTHANLDALSSIGAAIRAKLEAEVAQGSRTQISVIPSLIGTESEVARALGQLDKTGSNVEDTVKRARAAVASLGAPVQDFVEQTIRATVATTQLDTLSSSLKQKEADLAVIEKELADAKARQADEAAKLLELSDKLRDDQQALAQLVIDQTDRQEKLVQLGEDQEDVEREITRLEAAQAAALKELEPLRRAVADAAEAQRVAELAVRDATDALIPLSEKLKGVQADQSALQEEITARQRETNRAIEDARTALAGVEAKYQGQIDAQLEIEAAIDHKWKAELDGAQAAFNASEKLRLAEERRNNKALLEFDRQRAAAALLANPNQRIAAIARINKAEAEFTARNKDKLDAARLQAQLDDESLKSTQDKIALEKQDAETEIERIKTVIAEEKKAIQERLTALETAARIQARSDENALLAAQARVAAAQKEVDVQQSKIDTAQRDAELARRRAEDAQLELTNREKAVHDETDGAIETAKTKRDSIQEQRTALDDQLGDERREFEQRITREQVDLDLRKSKLEEQADIEIRPLAAREAAAKTDVEAAQTAVTNAGLLADKYNDALDSAKLRLDTEKTTASLIDEQRRNLDAIIAANKTAAGSTIAGARPAGTPVDQKEVDSLGSKLKTAFQSALDALKATDWGGVAGSVWGAVSKFFSEHPLDIKIGSISLITPPGPLAALGTIIGALIGGAAGAALGANIGSALAQTDIGKSIEAFLGKAVDGLKHVPDLLAGLISEPVETVKKLVGGLLIWFEQTFNPNLLKDIKLPFSDAFNFLVGHSLIPDLVNAIKDWFLKLPGFMLAPVREAWQKVTGKFTDLKNDLIGSQGLIPKTWEGITGAFNTGKEALVGAEGLVPKLWSKATGLFSDGKEAVIGPAGLWTRLTGGLAGPLSDAKSTLIGADGSSGILGDLWKRGTTLFQNLKTDAVGADGKGGLIFGLVDGAKSLIGSLPGAIFGDGGLLSGLKTQFQTLWNSVGVFLFGDPAKPKEGSGILGGLVSGIIGAFNSIVSGLFGAGDKDHPNLLSQVQTGFGAFFQSLKIFLVGDGKEKRGLLDSLFEIGKQMGQGLIDGLKSMLREIVNGLGDLAKLLPQPIKDFLGIKSPSTVFEDLGQSTLQGFQLGVEGERANVVGSVVDTALAIRDAFMLAFGPPDQEGSILWHLFHDDRAGGNEAGGFFPFLEARARAALDFLRLEVFVASFVALGEAIGAQLDKVREEAANKGESVGSALASAIARGIRSKIDEIAKAAADAVKAAIDAAKKEAGIASPAKAFVPIGEWSALGYIKGLLGKMEQVGRAASQLGVAAQAGLLANAPGFGPLQVPLVAGALGSPSASAIALAASSSAASSSGARSGRAQKERGSGSDGTNIEHQNIGVQNLYLKGFDNDLREQEIQGVLNR